MRNTVTTLRRRRSSMQAYDSLHPALRRWLHNAALPWSAASLKRLWIRALRDTNGDVAAALARMSAAETRMLRCDSPRIWGRDYPLNTP